MGRRRTKATLLRGLKELGPVGVERSALRMHRHVAALSVGDGPKAGQALHILDRFHIVQHLNQAVDEVRRAESAAAGKPLAAKLKKMRWKLLRQGRSSSRPSSDQALWSVGEQDGHRSSMGSQGVLRLFLALQSISWAGGFLDYWTGRACAADSNR